MPLRRPAFYGRAMRWRMWITIACAAALLAPATASAGFGATGRCLGRDDQRRLPAGRHRRRRAVGRGVEGDVRQRQRAPVPARAPRRVDGRDDDPLRRQHARDPVPRDRGPDRARPGHLDREHGRHRAPLPAGTLDRGRTTRSGPQLTLRNAGVAATVNEPALAATTDGDAVVAWRNSRSTPAGKVEARRVGAAGTLGPLLQPTEGPNVNGGVGVAPNPAGGALIAWVAPPGIAAMPVDATGAAGTVRDAGGGRRPGLAAALDRRAGRVPPALDRAGPARRPHDPDGQRDRSGDRHAQLVDGDGSFVSSFRIATNAADRSLGFSGHADGTVGARFFGADGTPQGSVLTAPAEVQFTFDAAVLGDGSALAFWAQGPSGQPRALLSRTIAAGRHRERAGRAVARRPTRRPSPRRPAASAWWCGSSARRRPAASVQVRARQLLPPPVCPDAAGTVVQGRPTTIALTCTGLQLDRAGGAAPAPRRGRSGRSMPPRRRSSTRHARDSRASTPSPSAAPTRAAWAPSRRPGSRSAATPWRRRSRASASAAPR